MKKYENIICEVVVLKNNDIVKTSGIVLPGEDLTTKSPNTEANFKGTFIDKLNN